MDPRIREHARVLVEHSLGVEAGDHVVVWGPPAVTDLVVALHEAVGRRGGRPAFLCEGKRFGRAHLRAADPEEFGTPEHKLALMEAADAVVHVRGHENRAGTSDVDPETYTAYGQAVQPVNEAATGSRFVTTLFPTPAGAQHAGMSTEAFRDLVWSAVDRDWAAQRERQAALVAALDGAETLRIEADGVDLRLGLDGMVARHEDGTGDLPGGEVYTAPVPDAVEGEFRAGEPFDHQGRVVEGARLRFEDGAVVDHDADRNAGALAELLGTDDGARRVGLLGFGTNPAVDAATGIPLLDTKRSGALALCLGRGEAATAGPDREPNDSDVRAALVTTLGPDAVVEADGRPLWRDGSFRVGDG